MERAHGHSRSRRLVVGATVAGAAAILAALPIGTRLRAGVPARPATPPPAAARLTDLAAYDRSIPDDAVLLEQLHDAIELRRREDFDRVLDARDPGELIEHATLTETQIERSAVDVESLFIVGDELFGYLFRPENGWGAGGADRTAPGYTPRLRRVHLGAAGGPDAFACLSCHFKGGPDGAGMQTQNAFLRGDGARIEGADQRNAPHLLGLGPVEALAREMTIELQAQAARAAERARAENRAIVQPLTAKGIPFGTITVGPAGRDVNEIEGVDPDLVVRPFGWKGHQATLRGMVEESLHLHQGLVSMGIQQAVRDGTLAPEPYRHAHGTPDDLDGDGIAGEIDAGMLTTVVGYLAQLEAPVMRPPHDPGLLDAWAAGRATFDVVGCAGCHVPTLELGDPLLDARAAPGADPKGPVLVVNVAKDGDGPKVEPKYAGARTGYLVHLFSDLKRHDLGPALATPEPQGMIPRQVFLTRSLWGLAETAPYLHDGRAPTVHEAIVAHGGEAAAARDAYLALPEPERAGLRVFLVSLSRQPKLFVP